MITQWTLENFKSVSGPETLDFAPLTVLAGANSSGKSTVIQSILLLSQTLRNRRTSRLLLLNGELARLGTFTDLIHRTNNGPRTGGRTQVKIGFGLDVPNEMSGMSQRNTSVTSISSNLTFRRLTGHRATAEGDQADLSRFELIVRSHPIDELADTFGPVESKLYVTPRARLSNRGLPIGLFSEEANHEDVLKYRVRMSRAFESSVTARFWPGYLRSMRIQRRMRRRPPRNDRSMWRRFNRVHPGVDLQPFGAILDRFLPVEIASWYNSQQDQLHQAFEGGIRIISGEVDQDGVKEVVDQFGDLGFGAMESWLTLFKSIDPSGSNPSTIEDLANLRWRPRQRQQVLQDLEHEQLTWVAEQNLDRQLDPKIHLAGVPEPFDDAIDALDNYFSRRIGYLGPLREDPRTVYDLPQSGDPQDVGLKGEYTAAVLDANKNVEVKYWHTEEEVVKTAPLDEAVLHWLGYFGMAEGVATTEVGQQGYTLTITDPSVSKPLDLTNVGVGVSQVLPIIVKGLLSDPESTVIYEQPEIHLHPATQAKIADFFIGLIRSGVQCIIETHSEYFINRMRLRIAEDEDDGAPLGDLIQILFAERTGGQTKYRSVEVNEYGAIVNWPLGFFDQSQAESEDLIEAAMNKRMGNSD